jgi:hypothetical protein
MSVKLYSLSCVVSLDGTTYGMTKEVAATSFQDAYEATKLSLRACGFTIIKVRRA